MHDRLERHLGEDVTVDVDAGSDFGQLQAFGGEPEYAPLGDVEHVFSLLRGVPPGEGPVADLLDELLVLSVAFDQQLALHDGQLEVARGEGAQEQHLLRVLADVDEAARAGQPRAEPGDVDVAFPVGLREPEERRVQTAAVVEVELIGHVDDRLRVGGRAERGAAGRDAADDAGLGGQRHQVGDLLLGGHRGDPFGDADAEVHYAVRPARDVGFEIGHVLQGFFVPADLTGLAGQAGDPCARARR